MKRRLLPWLAAILVGGAGLFLWLALPALRLREELDYWTHSHKWESPELTLSEAWARQAEGLRRLGPKAGPLLAKELTHGSSGFAAVIDRLRQKGPRWLRPKPGVVPALLRVYETATALALLGSEAHVPVNQLLQLVEHANPNARWAGLELLGVNGVASREIIASLDKNARGLDWAQGLAAISLYRLQPTNAWALATATAAFSATNSVRLGGVARWAIALARAGPEAKPFIPALHGALAPIAPVEDSALPALHNQYRVAHALWKIEGTSKGALICLTNARQLLGDPRIPNQAVVEHVVINLARDLAASREFCVAVRPVLEAMKPRASREHTYERADALRRVKQTLGANEGTPATRSP